MQKRYIRSSEIHPKVQKPGQAGDTLIQLLHRLAEDCGYSALKDELMRDRIVAGVVDDDISDDLQTRANLTLTDAGQSAGRAEAREEGQELLRGKVDCETK